MKVDDYIRSVGKDYNPKEIWDLILKAQKDDDVSKEEYIKLFNAFGKAARVYHNLEKPKLSYEEQIKNTRLIFTKQETIKNIMDSINSDKSITLKEKRKLIDLALAELLKY